MDRVSLLAQIRMLGIRRGFRVWRRYTAPQAPSHPVVLAHGERPTLPGYRRKH